MEYSYCPNCRKMTGHKRALGWGTFFGGVATVGISTLAIPFYPKRCIVCGRESSGKESKPQYSEFFDNTDAGLADEHTMQACDTKKCPICAEIIKLEAIKCRFCGESFDPAEVARQVAQARNEDDFDNRILCSDGSCIGVIGPNGRCKICGKPYKPDE